MYVNGRVTVKADGVQQKVKVKLSSYQDVEADRVVRC
jgi:hypothetical protein